MTGAAWLLAALQLAGLSDDLAACRKIDSAGERLACYDALTPSQPAEAKPEALPAPLPPAPTLPPAPALPAPPIANETPPAPKADENFGASSLPPPPKVEEPSRIDAHLFGRHDGWHKGTRFALDNGQVWVCIDDQEGFDTLDGNAVTISRNAVGSYWMHVARVAGDIRVRREQ